MADWRVVLSLIRLMVGSRLNVREAVAMAIFLEGAGIGATAAGPVLLKVLIDQVSGPSAKIAMIGLWVAAFVTVWTGTSLLSTWRMIYTTRVLHALTTLLTSQALAGYLPKAAFSKDGDSGRVLGLVERLPYSLQALVEGLIWRTGPILIQLVISLAIVGSMAPLSYSMIMAATFAGYIAVTCAGSWHHVRLAQSANAAAATFSQIVGDISRNAQRVVFNGAVGREIVKAEQASAEKGRREVGIAWSLLTMSAMQFAVLAAGVGILLMKGAADVRSGVLTVGAFVLLQAYIFRLTIPLSGIGYMLSQAGQSSATISEALQLDAPLEATAPNHLPVTGPAEIQIEHVHFKYSGFDSGLTDISVQIPAGSFTVIVGGNGAGKSTLAQMIAGALRPAAGRVLINQTDMAQIAAGDRHRNVLYVPQHVGLFNRSLGENLLYPPSNLSPDAALDFLRDWQFYEPGKSVDLTAAVGEQGQKLSGGQAQKLELARLLGVEVPVVVLDESTSALDPPIEKRVIASLRQRLTGKTTLLLITHRLSLASQADQVLMMDNGRLVGAGTHDDLLRTCAAYRALQMV